MSYWLFALSAPVALFSMIWLGVVAWRRRQMRGALSLHALAWSAGVWLVCSLGQMFGPQSLTYWLGAVAYVFIPWTPIAWLAFALSLTGRADALRSWPMYVLYAIAIVTGVLGVTMPLHGLIWASWRHVTDGPFHNGVTTYGAWIWAIVPLLWGSVLVGCGLILSSYARALTTYRKLTFWVAAGAILPLLFNVLFLFRVLPTDKDFSVVAFALTAGAFGLALFRFRLLDLQPTARSLLIDRMSEAVLVINPQGVVSDFNAALVGWIAATPPLGERLADCLPELALALERDQGEAELERDGEQRWFDWHATDVGEGALTDRLILLRDVTERRAAEHALQAAHDALQQRNADLDAFAHMVAHDLKTPINGIYGYAQLLALEGDEGPEMQQESTDAILELSQQMVGIIDGLLTLASVRGQAITPVPLDMERITSAALRCLGPLFDSHSAQVTSPDTWPCAAGYAPWVTACWVNYLTNAVKYGGAPPKLALGACEDGDGFARFWVDDNGEGVSPERRVAIFAPFERLHGPDVDGHGVGLSIVQRIVDRLGGACGMDQAPGGGSRFWFTLPAEPLIPTPHGVRDSATVLTR